MHLHERGVLASSRVYFHTPAHAAENLFLTLVCAGRYDCDGSYRVERNCYDSGLLLLVLAGEGYSYVRGRRTGLREGDLLLLDCYAEHCYGTDTGFCILWAHFSGQNARALLSAAEAYPPVLCAGSYPYSLVQDMETLFHMLDQKRRLPDAHIHRMLTELTTAFLLPSETAGESPSQSMERVAAYLSSRLSENVTIEQLAALAHLSPSQLIRAFKRETGFSPHQYLLEARLNAARYLLASTGLSLAQIAEQCGFTDASALVNSFRRRLGITPRAYARQQRHHSQREEAKQCES